MRKRLLAMLLCIVMLVGMLPPISVSAEVTSLTGDGSETAPYEISSPDELLFAVGKLNASDGNYTGKYYKLTSDVDLDGVDIPMINSFSGVFLGNGKAIKNLSITDTSGAVVTTAYGIGFIHKLSGRIQDVTFDDAYIYSNVDASANGYSGAAVVAAEICQNGIVSSVTVKNSTVDAGLVPKTGGITSMNSSGAKKGSVVGIIRNCVVEDTLLIGGPRSAGNGYGLMMGGIAGYSATSNIENCLVRNVTIQAANENTCPFYAAMLVGYGSGGNIEGNVIVSGKIERTSDTPLFTTVKYGGVISAKNSTAGGPFTGSYPNLIDTANSPTPPSGAAIAGTVKSADELKDKDTYISLGWDFDDIWEMKGDYPALKDPNEKGALKLEGTGAETDPYLIADKDDLLYAIEYLNLQDERIVGKALKLTADIDLTGVELTPIESFKGVLDGDGHTLYNMTLNDSSTADKGGEYRLAFIRTNLGTVRNLNFASPRITTTALSTGGFSGAAVIVGENGNGAYVTGCVVADAVVYAPNLPKAAGIAVLNGRNINYIATVSRCVFEGSLTCGPRAGQYGPMLGGISAYSATSTIEYCIVNADLIFEGNDTIQCTNIYAANICGYSNSTTYRSNVVYGGSITVNGEIADQRLGRVYAPISYGQALSDNIACEEVLPSEENGNNGRNVSAAALCEQETYEEIGYNFELLWNMNDGEAYPDRYPVPAIIDYSNNEINRITANIKGDNGTAIGFTFHYLEGKEMTVKVSENEDFTDAMTLNAEADGSVYKAEVTDLKGGTSYFYRVEGDGRVSDTGRFTTAENDGEFSFISIADTETANFEAASRTAQNIAGAVYASPDAGFILHGGDVASDARGELSWQDLMLQAQDSFLSMPVAVTVGDKDTSGISDHFNLDSSYYSFDYANAHIIVLDTNELNDEQIEWLKADVAAADKDWVILSMHKGPYTSGVFATTDEAKALRKLFIGELDGIGIDLVIQGHDHIMGHTYDLLNGEVTDAPVYTETVNGQRFDYTVDPEGIVYMMSGGMGEAGKQMSADDLDAYIMQFARSDGRGSTPTYSEITVKTDRIEVTSYEIKADMQPTAIEGFGIDRAVGKAEKLIADGDYTTARELYNDLSSAQKDAVSNYGGLVASEGGDALKADGGAWLEADADIRRSIVVTNDTTLDFNHAPVLVKLKNAPARAMAFYTAEGEALPYEVESYDADGTSYIWVNVPYIPSDSTAVLWVYFGAAGIEDADAVWDNTYTLVEHFEDAEFTAETNGNIAVDTENGDGTGLFDGNSSLTYASIGDDVIHMSVSAVVQMAEGSNGDAGIVSKYIPGDTDGKNTYLLGTTDGDLHAYYGATWWRSNEVVRRDYITELIADGEPHMITVAYDGFTIEIFIDGECVKWQTVMIENATFLAPHILTTIGAYSDGTGGFNGKIYDVQINGERHAGQWETFRYDNYFGDAVVVGEDEYKDGFGFTVAEVDGRIAGVLTDDADLTAIINGSEVVLGSFKAGAFECDVPVPGTGEIAVEVTARSGDNSVSVPVVIPATDTDAPAQPVIGVDGEGDLVLDSTADKGDGVDVTLNVNKYIPLTEDNTRVAVGSAEGKTPTGVDPSVQSYGALTDSLTTEVTDGTNPYQIYKVTLSDEEVSYESRRFTWQGRSDRQLHAYAYDANLGEWIKITSSDGTGELSMNIEIEGTQFVSDNTLYLMIFRGLGQEYEEMTDFIPEDGQYDFTMFWNSDTQYMSQFAGDMVYHQHQWIIDNYADKKGVITFNTGDIVNRTNLNYEYNWKIVDQSYLMFEEAGIPYTFNWGNHDLVYDGQPNETRYNRLYFPTSRLDENKGDWEVSYAPDTADGTTTRAMSYKQTIDGAKIMILSLAYNEYLEESDLVWAENEVASNPDYTVIIITHNYASDSAIKETNIKTRLTDVYSNVKLVLCGHLDGTAAHKNANGGFTVLQDYQGESGQVKHGGEEFLKLIQFDVENDLIYFNTYSPKTGATLSPIGEASDTPAEGLYQKNGDEFALHIELNGDKTRSFTTSALTLSDGNAAFSQTVSITEGESLKLTPVGLEAGGEYLYYATLTDTSGNVTVTPVYLFTEITDRVDYELEEAKTELREQLELVARFEESNYTKDSWAVFAEAKAAAEQALANAETASEVKAAAQSLTYASEGLTLKPRISFTDVKESHWFYNAVMYAAGKRIFKGNPDGSFAPNKAITRAEFVMVLANYSGEDYSNEECSKFTDVKSSAWYYHAVAWAANRGIVNGMSADKFAPTGTITRQDLCLMLTNYLKYKGVTVDSVVSEPFADDAKIGSWAYDAVYVIKSIGVVSGMGANEFQPRGNATRAQVAQMMMKFDEYLNK